MSDILIKKCFRNECDITLDLSDKNDCFFYDYKTGRNYCSYECFKIQDEEDDMNDDEII